MNTMLPTPSEEAAMNAQESTEEIVPTFFLDAVPNELLDTVLRFFSRVPSVKKWESHILLADLIPLFKVDGQIGTMMKSRFTALCVAQSGEAIIEKEDYHWELPTEGILTTTDINAARTYVSEGGGQALRTLIIAVDKGFVVDDFANNCPNVTSLSVLKADPEWVSRYGKQLKKLEIATGDTSCISQHCSSLQELNLPLWFSEDNYSVDLWEKVGRQLEKLTVYRYTGVPVVHLENIEKYCRNLRHIDIRVNRECGFQRAQVLKLICSYGEQLECAHLYNMGESELLDIVSACKNCRFHLYWHPSARLLPSLQILGHQLESLYDWNYYFSEEHDYDKYKTAWDRCVNLRRLSVKVYNLKDIKAIMATPKTNLEDLAIKTYFNGDVKEIWDICARGCGNIRRLKYDGSQDPSLSLDAFDKFIERNKSSLSSVYLQIYDDAAMEKVYENYMKLIAPFVRLPVSIEITTRNEGLFYDLSEKCVRKLADCGALVRIWHGVPLYRGL